MGGSAAEDTTQHRTTNTHIHKQTHYWGQCRLCGCHHRRVGAVAGGELRGQLLPERDQHTTEVLPLVMPAVPPLAAGNILSVASVTPSPADTTNGITVVGAWRRTFSFSAA